MGKLSYSTTFSVLKTLLTFIITGGLLVEYHFLFPLNVCLFAVIGMSASWESISDAFTHSTVV